MNQYGFSGPADVQRAYPHLVNKHTMASHLNGNRPISKQYAEIYYKILGVDPATLLWGSEPSATRSGDMDVPFIPWSKLPEVSVPSMRAMRVSALPKGDWVATTVEDDSMSRVAAVGATLVIDRAELKLREGKFYIFVIDGEDVVFRMFRASPARLVPYSTQLDYLPELYDGDKMSVFGRIRKIILDI